MLNTQLKSQKLLAGLVGAGLSLMSLNLSAKSLGPEISQLLTQATEQDAFEVIVTFEGNKAVDSELMSVIQSTGVLGGVSLKSLPMVGIKATKAQIEAIYASDKVRSIWYNAPLSLENDGSTQITGVDRLRADSSLRHNGMPFSGRGIGVVVNDSGVDGTHGDIKYPNHVVQNVLAQTNLNSLSSVLPITYQENVDNTDIAGGHGSHVAGIIGGNGSMSSGKYQGVAPGAKIIGYGSGAGLFILDTLGGFDYALTHQFDYNIRVISNSFGNTGDIGTDFNPDDPTNIATKKLSDNGVIVVFSAGNSGSGEGTITGNFKKAPWVITVAAGDKTGNLADFSSRGVKGKGGVVSINGEQLEWQDRPTITAPGVDVISVRASLSSLSALSIADDSEIMDINHVPYYTAMSGTSMAAPHISGVVALMLEANPSLTWREVKEVLQNTATNMPGMEEWEVGAGYVNAYAAVQSVVDQQREFGTITKLNREFNAQAQTSVQAEYADTVDFSPIGDNPGTIISVSSDASMLMVSANITENTVGLSLTSPSGKRYGSSIALPVLGENVAVTAPAEPGDWVLKANGIGGVSGVDVDPLGLTNGYALPGTIPVKVKIVKTDGYTGLDDVPMDHPAKAFIEMAVSEQLVDAAPIGFMPDDFILRQELADFLTLGAGVRQSNSAKQINYVDVNSTYTAAINSVTQKGGALRNTAQDQAPVMLTDSSMFLPTEIVNRNELAYSLVQSLALQDIAETFNGDITVIYNDERIALTDQNSIPQHLKGYVQLALDLGILNAYFDVSQGRFDLEPTVTAHFKGSDAVTRADYAVAAIRTYKN
ncbi:MULTISPECIES: S8 family serine peptidase [Pseudoalteromonas]|uniref:S8 family serine peptidase n=1 Tax=Pseudoalteromonas TaxID=53246 RepID=UPI0015840597|nr:MULTISPECIES: S8 family serine peptidase [Pseudoalteromonas]MDI4654592.1 S8 family serine peptidase [Pseudoalteromonas shioyasakiensis]NUJ40990.1 S8 family serine peptidase [Pseudoalteromonas sp. 0303]